MSSFANPTPDVVVASITPRLPASRNPTQFDLFGSLRFEAVVSGIEDFAAWVGGAGRSRPCRAPVPASSHRRIPAAQGHRWPLASTTRGHGGTKLGGVKDLTINWKETSDGPGSDAGTAESRTDSWGTGSADAPIGDDTMERLLLESSSTQPRSNQ